MRSDVRYYTGFSKATRHFLFALCVLLLISAMHSLALGQSADLVRTPVDPGNRVSLRGHHPAWANAQNDLGEVPPETALERLTILLNRPPQREQAYTQFLQDQQNPRSPNYHHWLTSVEIGKRFGTSLQDINAITGWLQSQNLHVDSVSNSRDRITLSGTVFNLANAFGTQIHYFMVEGEKRISVSAEPQIPAALAGVIKSISGFYTVKISPLHKSTVSQMPLHKMTGEQDGITPDETLSGGGHVLFPADFATIYNVKGVAAGLNGTGQTIAIVGRSRVCAADITNFASLAAVSINSPTVIVPPGGVDPGPAACTGSASMDQSEATLDVTRSGSIAQSANIDLVISGSTSTVDGVTIAAQYVVDTTPVVAHIMSISFGVCEATAGLSGVNFLDSLFKQAAGEGISVFVSSDDSAAAGCDPSFSPPPTSQILSPNAFCSSSYATCVGGTEFADFANPTTYWSASNGPGFESALGYIPEGAWNEPENSSSALQVAGTGGGVSSFIATPTWQTGTGVPSARAGRYTPDVAFSAAYHDGYFGCMAAGGGSCVQSGGSFGFSVFSGTSAAAPDMAGIAALLNQSEGSAQGLLNPALYQLAATPSNNVFNDVTVASSGVTGCVVSTPSMCNNSTAGTTGLTGGLSGYLVTAGYDESTGLGSINVANLLANWSSAFLTPSQTTLTTSASQIAVGTSVTFTAMVAPNSGTGTPTGIVTFNDGSTQLGTGTLSSSGVATFNTSAPAAGNHSISAVYGGDSTFAGSTSSAVMETVVDFTITISPTSLIANPGTNGTTILTVTPNPATGFSPTVNLTCSLLLSEATCSLSPASITLNGATSSTMTVTTTAPHTRAQKAPMGLGLFIPVGLVVSVGGFFGLGANWKHARHSVVWLGLTLLLTICTLSLLACGGSSAHTDPGTPAGTYAVTITATSGGIPPITHSQTVTLTVH